MCDARGRIVAQQASVYQPDTPRPLWAEQWPQVWVDAVFECIAGAPRAASSVVYETLFQSYKALYPALRTSMHDLHDQAALRRGHPVTCNE